MRLLVTGGAGFIGSNFLRYWIRTHEQDEVINLDTLTYAGNLENLRDIQEHAARKYQFVQADITDEESLNRIMEAQQPDCIVNFAAESHNSLAIVNPGAFFKTNVLGTQTLLEVARKNKISRFHHISTCEVYGDLDLETSDRFSETSPYRPRTPYNASKAGADMAVRAYFETFGLPVTISNCCNNYGPYQFPEKVIPLFITNILSGEKIPVYQSSRNRREWVHVEDHCRAIDLILHKGKLGETYNIGTGIEKSVDEIAGVVLAALEKDESWKTYVPDRPVHDRRYLLDSTKIQQELGWRPEKDFDQGIEETIRWYKEHREWWQPLREKMLIQETGWKK